MKNTSRLIAVLMTAIGSATLTACAAPTLPTPGKSGVNINPITRNQSVSKVSLQLAKDGKALLPIVISEKASVNTKKVAADLKITLDAISGASFEIKTGDGEAGLVVGTLAEFPDPSLSKPLEIVNGFDGKEAYAIRTHEKRVVLLGATDLGTSHAVYRFLDELGCRWFFPAKEWHVIPKTRDLKFALDITDRPSFLARSIWAAWGLHDGTGPDGRSAGADAALWKRRNHMGESFTSDVGHASGAIAHKFPKEMEAHPEYLALVGGKRKGPQFDYGNPGLRKLIADYAINYFKEKPDADMVGIGPADGGGASESPESQAYGTASDSVFRMANEVALAVQKAYPRQNKMVGVYAYNWHSDPPPFALEPNVYIQLTTGFNNGKLTFPELLEQWPKKAENLGFREYYSVWKWDGDRWPGGRIAKKDYAIDMIRSFEKANRVSGAVATSISAESGNNWGPNGRGYYLASKLMWNPDRDPEAILDDFYQKAFGAGAVAMKRYYDLSDSRPLMSAGVIGALFRAVNEASLATIDDASVQARLDHIKQYLRYEHLNRINQRDEALKLAYRTRWTYMTHWYAMERNGAGKPSADPAKSPKWQDETPVTHQETEKWFQEGLAFFPDLKIPAELEFSTDLVPVDLSGVAGVAKIEAQTYISVGYRGDSRRFMLFSRTGEALRLKIHAGATHGGEKHSYTLQSSDGAEITSGLPKGNENLDLTIPVPRAGVYYLDYFDAGSNVYTIETPPEQIVALPLTKKGGSGGFRGPAPDLFFYVPKGTKQIDLYSRWGKRGSTVHVFDPTGVEVKDLGGEPEYHSLPVVPGQDGKVWKLSGKPNWGFATLYFYNLPDILSPSPAQMLLPKDVVQKDGLKPVK